MQIGFILLGLGLSIFVLVERRKTRLDIRRSLHESLDAGSRS